MLDRPIIGATYKHKGGNRHKVLSLALRESDAVEMVVYQSLDPALYPRGTIWVRPLTEWNDRNRFTLMSQE